jgi:hypothetical protein
VPRKKSTDLEVDGGKIRQGLTRGTKAIANTSGAGGRYRTSIALFKDPKTGIIAWDIVEQFFIEGWPTTREDVRYWPNLKELSEMTGLSYQRIQNKSSANRWFLQQQTFKNAFQLERKKRRIETLVDLSFDFDDIQLEVATRGTEMVLRRQEQIRRIDEAKQTAFEKALAKLGKNEEDLTEQEWKDLRGGAYHAEIEALAKAASAFQEIGMKALGTDKERIELTGIEGGPIAVRPAVEELDRDDPERLLRMIVAKSEAGLLDDILAEQPQQEQIPVGDKVLEITAAYDDVIDVEFTEVENDG